MKARAAKQEREKNHDREKTVSPATAAAAAVPAKSEICRRMREALSSVSRSVSVRVRNSPRNHKKIRLVVLVDL